MSEPSDPTPPKPSSRRSPAVLVGLGLMALVALGGALVMTRAASPASREAGMAAPAEVAQARKQAEEEQRKVAQLQEDLSNAKDDASRRKLAAALTEAQQPATRAGGKGKKTEGGSGRRCAPGDPLCAELDGDAAPSPAASAAPAAMPGRGGLGGPTGGEVARNAGLLDGEAPIDPNGRFATTYRPGGGYLNAFEAAVAQGILTAGERDLVNDVGARYAPSIEAPKGKALTLKADWERAKMQPDGGTVHLRLGLRSAAEAPAARPHLSVHLVMDISGSMGGKPMESARQAAQALVDKLAPTDDFSLVTFSTSAKVEIPDGVVGARRDQIKKTIAGIKEGGGTNIGDGLGRAYEQAHAKTIPDDAVRVVLLLSDGRANEGMIQQGQLAGLALGAFQDGIQTSTFGIGTDYDGPLMSAIASDGAGGYYYLRDSEQIAPALTSELDRRLDPVATAVEVRVRLKPETELLRVYGSRRLSASESAVVRAQEVAADQHAQKHDGIKANRANDQEGGMRFFMPAFSRDDSHAMLVKLRIPAGVGSKPVALIELKYKDRISKKNVTEELPLAMAYASSDAESGGTIDPSVARTVQGFLAGEALTQASALVAGNNRPEAARLLGEREAILREAAASLGEPLFLRDADRLARMLGHVRGGQTGTGDPLVLAMLLETSARVHLR